MNKRILLVGAILVLSLLLLVGCGKKEEIKKIDATPPVTTVEEVEIEPPVEEKKEQPPAGCTTNMNCSEGKVCIEGSCGTIAELYKTEGCEKKCNFGSIVVTTSDGETYTITKGQGSYTAAGALQWKVDSVPDYCPMDEVIAPIDIKMVNYGNVLRQYYLTLKEGETSEVMEHPVVPNIKFTVTLKSLEEKCS